MRILKSILLKKAATDFFIIIPLSIFSLLFLPFINSIPFLDGNINFVQSILFYEGGFDLYFELFSSVHPPLKILVLNMLYMIFGISSQAFIIIGLFWGILSITSFYFLLKKLSPGSEKFGALLFSINPLFLAVGIFGLTDYILTALLMFTIYSCTSRKNFLFFLGLCGITLVKETGLLIILIFLVIDSLFAFKRGHKKRNLILYIIPTFLYFLWSLFLNSKGLGAWSDWIFAETADKGTFYTILNNIVTLKIFNVYATQHFLQLLFLNFNWILIILSIISTSIVLHQKSDRKKLLITLKRFDQKSKIIFFIIIFCPFYALTVLTLQTYTIPRYALPIIPFIILWFSISTTQIKNFYIKTVFIFTAFIFSMLGLFFSVDPIANALWGKVDVLGEKLYATNYKLSGNDGLTYNYQYFKIIKKRTEIIHGKSFPTGYCPYIFPDPNNDRITATTLKFSQSFPAKVCGLTSSQGF